MTKLLQCIRVVSIALVMTSVNDLDSQIAALEGELGRSSSAGSDSDARSEEVDDVKVFASEFAPIPALKEELLPGGVNFVGDAIRGKRERDKKLDEEKFDPRSCDVCPIRTVFRTKDAWVKHRRDLLHRQNVVLAAGAVYKPSSHTALYCRVCKLHWKSEEELLAHRKTEEHKENRDLDRRSSYCQICKKQFTSAVQLKEHCMGKNHVAMIGEKQASWRKQKRLRTR